jgi:hypothetical protein
MLATLILAAAGVLVTFAGAPNPVAILLGVMLTAIAFGRCTVWRRVDNRPVTRDEHRSALAELADWWRRR